MISISIDNPLVSIKTIDESIDSQLDKLDSIIDNLEFNNGKSFTLDSSIQKENVVWQEYNCQGIYLFEIETSNKHPDIESWMDNFKGLWSDPKYHMKFVPGCKKIRMAAHKELKEWIPLYIGKSRNIASRIHGHIFRELDKTTFAMKLKARENLYGQRFRISYINLDVNNYDMLIPYVERRLRNKINPIVGKQ